MVLAYPLLIALGGGAILALLAALAHVSWRPRLALQRDFRPQTVVAGEVTVAVLGVTNQSRWPSPAVRIVDRLGDHDVELAVRSLATGATTLLRYDPPTRRRGRVELGPLQVLRADPWASCIAGNPAAATTCYGCIRGRGPWARCLPGMWNRMKR